MIQSVTRSTEARALTYLSRSPYLNVFLKHVLLHDPEAPARKNVAVALADERVIGVAYCGRQLAIAAEPEAIAAFGEYVKRHRGERMILGQRDTVRAFWEAVRKWHVPPRLVRDRQLVMAIDRPRLRPYERSTNVRHARIDEWSAVADGSAEMIRHELAYDPRLRSPEFAEGIRQMIERELWWIGETNGRLCFFCNVGPWCDRTVQLQGIWSPPAMRGRGLATASLAAICDRLLDASPTLSLYVNDFNEAAIALYRRVGFEHVGDFQTILF
ncbi:MAG: GNAT family N-acetyltransferase [Candidatus Eremiobacteraeota bacterium]|nr:GNAT family N-acetyltransferase [Candidatus Eremiobacteraeota bacterium]